MDFKNLTFFSAVKQRLDWLGQRQEVVSQNIANSDTPKYRATDLKAFDFKEIIRRQSRLVNMDNSNPMHLGGPRRRIKDFSEVVERNPFETSPDGNSVVIEEQMAKMNESVVNHQLAMSLYKKHLKMFKVALGKS